MKTDHRNVFSSCYILQDAHTDNRNNQNFWLVMNSKGVLVLWWEARLYPTWLLLTKGIRASRPHTSVHYSGEETAAGFHTAVLRHTHIHRRRERGVVVFLTPFAFLDMDFYAHRACVCVCVCDLHFQPRSPISVISREKKRKTLVHFHPQLASSSHRHVETTHQRRACL